MKNNNRRGFTIVELVIVIAVVAILAAVLIPTFAGLVAQANLSADQVAVKNMNTALSAVFPAPDTFIEAKEALASAGYNTTKNIIPISAEHIFAWGEEQQAVLLIKIDGENRTVVYPERYANVTYDSLTMFDLSLPGARVAENGPTTLAAGNAYIANLNNFGRSQITENDIALQCSYAFGFAEDEDAVKSSAYASWYADFVITFDKDVTGGIQLAGQYDSFLEEWIVIDSAHALDAVGETVLVAGTRVPLLGLVGMNFTYEEINSMMEYFNCGATDDGTNGGTTMTVELCLFNPADPNEYKVVTSNTHTFP